MDNNLFRSQENSMRRSNSAYVARGRPIIGSALQSRLMGFQNFRPSGGSRDDSPEPPITRSFGRSFLRTAFHPYHDDNSFISDPPSSSVLFYPPLPPPQPDLSREFHSVPVLSGPFPISQIPESHPLSGQFHDTPVVLGPFHLHNIPYFPGSIPIHQIPYIPSPENVPNCPVVFEADENDPNLTYPGYSILIPVPFGAIPAVEIYILPSDYLEGRNHVLIFQHGYMMPPRAHFVYLTPQNANDNNPPHMPNGSLNNQRLLCQEIRMPSPAIGMRIGRQTTLGNVCRGSSQMYNPITRTGGFGQTTPLSRSSFREYRSVRRRPFGQGWENGRGHFDNRFYRMRSDRPLHSCGSNDPTHDCLWDQHQRRPRTVNLANVSSRKSQATAISKLSGNILDKVFQDKKADDLSLRQGVVLKASKEETENCNDESEKAVIPNHLIKPITILRPSPRKTKDNRNATLVAVLGATSNVKVNENQELEDPSMDSLPENLSSEDAVPRKKKKLRKTAPKKPKNEDLGEGTCSKTKRYRPSYNYLRSAKIDSASGGKVKIQNYDEDGNRVPTYRQAVHYCTKYHEKQTRKKFRQQRRDGLVDQDQLGAFTILDEWLGDCTTTESDSDSSFLTDEGDDQRNPPNFKEMLAYYYKIKALIEKEKKKKEDEKH